MGAGPLRVHDGSPGEVAYKPSPVDGFDDQPSGADLLLDSEEILAHYPFIADDTTALLHTRRCGWFSAQQMGMYMLDQAKSHGTRLVRSCVDGVTLRGGRVSSVRLKGADGDQVVDTDSFVVAAGPYIREVASLVGVELPVINELHAKVVFRDHLGVVPRHAPMMIWNDPVALRWSSDERSELESEPDTQWLLRRFPSGAHFRPEGGLGSQTLLMLWTYDVDPVKVVWPPRFDPVYAEIVLRGLTRMIPGLSVYLGRAEQPSIDGGYYCKTQENRPLIGPLPVDGAFIIGALSGFGQMASQAAAELVTAHITGRCVPVYAPAFLLSRYEDPDYLSLLDQTDSGDGQL
jgi:glycine/D-amino acid oxidase-like deaminating enzyme